MNKEIFEMLCNDDSFEPQNAEELRNELELEMTKADPDVSLIDELVRSIMEIENIPQINVDIKQEYKKIAVRERKKFRFNPLKKIIAAACAVLVISNIISYTVYGKNIFSAFVTRFGDNLTFDFRNEGDYSAVHTKKYDDYGIKKKFEEEGYYIEVPMYIPEGFEITDYMSTDYFDSYVTELVLKRGDESIGLGFIFFKDEKYVNSYGIDHADEYKEITINGHDGYHIKSEKTDWYTYRFDNTAAVHDFKNMDSAEVEKIINSIR